MDNAVIIKRYFIDLSAIPQFLFAILIKKEYWLLRNKMIKKGNKYKRLLVIFLKPVWALLHY